MINVSDILLDPDFLQSFTINRSTGSWVLGGFQSTVSQVQASGVVDVASSRDLAQVPEGDRVTGSMAFYSTQPLYLTRNGQTTGLSDTITWQGDKYRLVQIFPYVDYGYYMAIGVRMTGE